MSDIVFRFLETSSAIFSTIVIMVVATVASLKIYLQYKERIAAKETSEIEFRTVQGPSSLDNLAELLIKNFQILNSFYSENLAQYRASSIASISIAVLGFIVIISGILIAVLTKEVTLGSVSSAAGIIIEAAAMLFFKQNKTFQGQMESSLNTLVSSQYLMTSIALTRDLDGEAKAKEIVQINDHLRSLMNLLHGMGGYPHH